MHSTSIFLLFAFITACVAHTPGTVTVDTLTFDKVRSNFDVVLAKFDDKYRMYFYNNMIISSIVRF